MRSLLLINAVLDPGREREIAAGVYPRKDYLELRAALGADVLDLATLERRLWTRLVRRAAGPVVAQALLAWSLSARYDAVFADQETTGFALAALYKLLRVRRRDPSGAALPRTRRGDGDVGRPRLTMIGHLLSPRGKQLLVRGLRLRKTIDGIVVHSSPQQRLATRTLGLASAQVMLVPYQTDERFWTPRNESRDKPPDEPVARLICSVGLEYRDYDTLIDAVAGLSVEVVVAAASYWSTHRGVGADRPLPDNLRVGHYDYAALRDLYARSLFVVVPLRDVENQAGITTILEAMAMGKAVIVSHTRGQTDVVRDRRSRDRARPDRPSQPDWALHLGATDETARGHTGIYVQPGDPTELRRAIVYLLEHPDEARTMGANGRRLVEETMGLDLFTRRLAAIITGEGASASGDMAHTAPAAAARQGTDR